MLEEYQYPKHCRQCGEPLPPLAAFWPKSRPISKALYWISAPLMAAWAVGSYFLSPVWLVEGGDFAAILVMLLFYLGPGVLLVLSGMCLSRVREAGCRRCQARYLVKAPSLLATWSSSW